MQLAANKLQSLTSLWNLQRKAKDIMPKRDGRYRETPRVFDKSGSPTSNLIGLMFGKLKVLEWAGKSNLRSAENPKKDVTDFWVCWCDCGNPEYNPVIACGRWLKYGNTSSCGCKRRKHRMAGTRIYHIWSGMIGRCTNPQNDDYRRYGGRGITVCSNWRESFENFYADMGDPPTDKHTLDRRDVNDNYSPENCRWATRKQQNRNRRDNRPITWNGEAKLITEWAEDPRLVSLGITARGLATRLYSGWTVEEAMTTPPVVGKLITWQGETLTMMDWSRRLGTSKSNVVSKRLSAGWTLEDALTTPLGGKPPSSHMKS